MSNQVKQSFSELGPVEKRRLYEAAFLRARRIIEVPQVQWLQPDPADWVLAEVLAECESRMAGCSRGEAEEALELVVKLMRCEPLTDMVASGYINIMMMFSRELLMPSIRLAVAAERYHVMPTVGALCHAARVETELRRSKISQLKIAITRLELKAIFEAKQGDRSRAARVRGSAASQAPGKDPPARPA